MGIVGDKGVKLLYLEFFRLFSKLNFNFKKASLFFQNFVVQCSYCIARVVKLRFGSVLNFTFKL